MPKIRKTLPAELPEPEIIDIPALGESYRKGDIELICVLGPTASGKTRYAVALAKNLGNCEIISADSRQVYRGMDIGTGKDLSEYVGVPYHLIDIAYAGTQYNVHQFCEDFAASFSDIRSRGAIPILCGGTGLYISAVTSGYDFRNTKPLSSQFPPLAGEAWSGGINTFFIGTLVSREERNAKIDARLRARLKEGMIEEIQGLLDGTNPGCPPLERPMPGDRPSPRQPISPEVLLGYGLEYKFVTQYLKGEMPEEELFARLSTAIHQFAKRQMTWFRGMERSGIRIHWVKT